MLKRKVLSMLLMTALVMTSVFQGDIRKAEAATAVDVGAGSTERAVSEVAGVNFDTSNIRYSGNIGKIKWGIDSSGVFAFYHSDATPGKRIGTSESGGWPLYSSYSEVPWYNVRSQIRHVTLANLDSYIVGNMDYMFYDCQNLESVVMLPAVSSSMKYTFSGDKKLKSVGCIMPYVTNMNYCFQDCSSLTSNVVFNRNPSECTGALYNCPAVVVTMPEAYNVNSKLASAARNGYYKANDNSRLTLYGISKVNGTLVDRYSSDTQISRLKYGQKLGDVEVGSTGGLRYAYSYGNSNFLHSVYVPYSTEMVKSSSSVTLDTRLTAGTHAKFLDIVMKPIVGTTVQPGSFHKTGYKDLTVEKCPVSECSMTISSSSYTYDGSAKTPSVSLTNPYSSAALVKDTDYTVSYSNNVNAGTATVTVTGKGNYQGTASRTFSIANANMSSSVSSSGYTGTYDGIQHGISVMAPSGSTIRYGTSSGTYNQSSSPTFSSAGTHTVYYQVTKPNYATVTGSNQVIIHAASMSVSASGYTGTYDKSSHGISVSVSRPSGGATVRYGTSSGNYNLTSSPTYKNVGTYTVYYQVTAPNYNTYTGSATVRITKKDIADCTIGGISAQTYGGTGRTPAVTVQDGGTVLAKGTDFTVSYSDNVDVGTATVTVKGSGNYEGSKRTTFRINPLKIQIATENADGYLHLGNVVYSGTVQKPSVSVYMNNSLVTLREGTDYTISCTDETQVGFARATVTGKGNFTGSAIASFAITAYSMENQTESMKLSDTEFAYTGKEIHPEVTITSPNGEVLQEGRDYTLEYVDAVELGTAKVKAVFRGNYCGTITKEFTIVAAEISDVELSESEYVYDGISHEPEASGYERETDYTVVYENNVNAGTAAAVFTFKGSYTGTVRKEFTISPRPLKSQDFELVHEKYIYDGTYKCPQAENRIGIEPGQDEENSFKVEYDNNMHATMERVKAETQSTEQKGDSTKEYRRAASPAVVTITGSGNYTGTVTKEFDIYPQIITDDIIFPDSTRMTFEQTAVVGNSTLTRTENKYGKFAWENPDEKVSVKNDGYSVAFTPDNARDYDWSEVPGWDAGKKKVVRVIPLTVERLKGSIPVFATGTLAEGEMLESSAISSKDKALGTFHWKDGKETVVAEKKKYDIVFVPADTENCDWSGTDGWDAEKKRCQFETEVIVIVNPTATSVNAGDKLSESKLSSEQKGATYEWTNPDEVVGDSAAGKAEKPEETDKPDAGETPSLRKAGKVTTYLAGTRAGSDAQADEAEDHDAVYHYKGKKIRRPVPVPIRQEYEVDEAEIPELDEIVYSPARTLADIKLPAGKEGTWTWDSPATVPVVKNGGYPATFTPEDSETYNPVTVIVPLKVRKAVPEYTVPVVPDYVYDGRTLSEISLPAGWTFDEKDVIPVPGVHSYAVTYTPEDTDNYSVVCNKEVTFTVTEKTAGGSSSTPGSGGTAPSVQPGGTGGSQSGSSGNASGSMAGNGNSTVTAGSGMSSGSISGEGAGVTGNGSTYGKSGVSQSETGKLSLSRKKVTLRIGQKLTLKMKKTGLKAGKKSRVSAPKKSTGTKVSRKKTTKKNPVKKTAKTKKKTSKVKWSSSRKKVATVSRKGVVKAKKKGKTVITARLGKNKYTCTVTVLRKPKKAKKHSQSRLGSPAGKSKKKLAEKKVQVETPVLCKASKSNGKTILIMRAVADADGYEVVAGGKKTSMSCALSINYEGKTALYKAFSGNCSSFQVRAFKYSGGKKVYGKWASISLRVV